MRGVSTVFDVTVFLLLVAVAVATLAVPAAQPPTSTADDTAETLAASTANVTYAPALGDGESGATRTVTGSNAGLLVRAAVANLTVEGTSVSPTTGPFRTAVQARTAEALAWAPDRTGVVATWEPYPGAPIQGTASAGASPPPGVDVSTATMTVPAPMPSAEPAARDMAPDGHRDVARVVVDSLLETTLAREERTGIAARRDRAHEARLRAYADALDVSVPGDCDDGCRAAVAADVREELVDLVAADLEERYESPDAAATAVETGLVRIVVREWSP